MSIFVDKDTRVLVQGITGRKDNFMPASALPTAPMWWPGSPGQGRAEDGWCAGVQYRGEGRKTTGANCSLIFVPPPFAADAIMEAVDAGVELIVAITEGIPVMDMMRVKNSMESSPRASSAPTARASSPPAQCKVGIMPGPIHKPGGPIGVVSRSGTLTYEVVHQLTQQGIGQTTCIGIGGDPVNGTNFIDCLDAFENDPATQASSWWARSAARPRKRPPSSLRGRSPSRWWGLSPGLTAPPGRRMGHAGAIISGSSGTAQGKIDAMETAGIHVCRDLGRLGEMCARVFS